MLTIPQNTTDPRSNIPTQESAGPVASDSLAAESTRAGGKFGENRGSAPMSVSGSSSTLNNTDTSAATTLAPAPDAQEREAKAAWQETSDSIKGSSGAKSDYESGSQQKSSGEHSTEEYSGGSSGVKSDSESGSQETSSGGHSTEGSSGGSSGAKPDYGSGSQQKSSGSHRTEGSSGGSTSAQSSTGGSADAAPSYLSSAVSDAAKSGKPHGKNITEGGFDADPSKNASFNSEIGGENDPGRAAENQFQRQTMQSGNDAAPGVPRQKGLSDDGQFDVLETEQGL